MPELPEVETVRAGLQRLITGRKIVSVDFDNPKSFPNDKRDVDLYMIGSKITAVRRRAKVLMIDLDSGYSLMIHLKMTGQMIYRDGSEQFGGGHPSDSLVGRLPAKSTRVSIEFDDASHLYFNDQRKFGWMRLMQTDMLAEVPFMMRVGPEPFDDALTPEVFAQRLRRRSRSNIKSALLDQSVLAGLGNIYVDETLWLAAIHPTSIVGDLDDEQIARLLQEARGVLRLAIDAGGSTDSTYVDAEGRKGSYLGFAKVFRRQGQACMRCESTIIKTRVAGRGTHICEQCQIVAGWR